MRVSRQTMALCLLLGACSSGDTDRAFTFRDAVIHVQGSVGIFQQDGTPLTHHFAPVALIFDETTHVTTFSPPLAVDDFMSGRVDTEGVAALIKAAEAHCARLGRARTGPGAAIWLDGPVQALVDFCAPTGAP